MKITYKQATADDAAIIAELADVIWRQHYRDIISEEQISYMLEKMYSPESIAKQLSEGHVFTLLLADDKPSGYVSLSTEDGKKYKLHKFYILPELQGKGLGSKLLNDVIPEQASEIELTVNRQNFRSINFYFKNNFRISAVADFDIGNGYVMNDFIMTRKLS